MGCMLSAASCNQWWMSDILKDKDFAGAQAGNILGAICGFEAMDNKWKEDLELSDIILELADDLCYGCMMDEYSSYEDPAWSRKYIEMKRWDKT